MAPPMPNGRKRNFQYYFGKDKAGRMRRLRRSVNNDIGYARRAVRTGINESTRLTPFQKRKIMKAGQTAQRRTKEFGKYLNKEHNFDRKLGSKIKGSANASRATFGRSVNGVGKSGFFGKAGRTIGRNSSTLTRNAGRISSGFETVRGGYEAGGAIKRAVNRKTGRSTGYGKDGKKEAGLGSDLGRIGGGLAGVYTGEYATRKLIKRVSKARRAGRINAARTKRLGFDPREARKQGISEARRQTRQEFRENNLGKLGKKINKASDQYNSRASKQARNKMKINPALASRYKRAGISRQANSSNKVLRTVGKIRQTKLSPNNARRVANLARNGGGGFKFAAGLAGAAAIGYGARIAGKKLGTAMDNRAERKRRERQNSGFYKRKLTRA